MKPNLFSLMKRNLYGITESVSNRDIMIFHIWRKQIFFSIITVIIIIAFIDMFVCNTMHTNISKNFADEGDMELIREYKEYFYENYANDDMVYLADVTHDGEVDMLIITVMDNYRYECSIFSRASDGLIYEIYKEIGGSDHVGGLYNLFIREAENGKSVLGKIGFGMWQGRGRLDFTEYYIKDGEEEVVNYIELSTDDKSKVNVDGDVTDEAYYYFTEELNAKLKEFHVICTNDTEFGYDCQYAVTYPSIVFQNIL